VARRTRAHRGADHDRRYGAAVLTRVDGCVRAELPFSWLVEVWAKGLATIYGRFCLAAETNDEKRWRLTTIAPGLGDIEAVTVTLSDDSPRV
jgi:hypothetical protein